MTHRLSLVLLLVAVAAVAASCGDDETGERPAPPASPADRDVVLSLDNDTPQPGETIQLTVENHTATRLEYGLGYRLERRVGDSWRWINRDAAFALILKIVEPGKREREDIGLPDDLRPGRYRIVKSFTAPASDREIEAAIEFTVSAA